ncbi:MAG: peptidylprolyl isomerase [Ruminococcus sp.]|nr:peptidylprolyl isomerase [Ruminococcus sp.]
MIKKLTALVISLCLAASMAACGSDDSSTNADSIPSDSSLTDSQSSSSADSLTDSSEEIAVPEPTLTIDGESVDINNLVMCTIDGMDISFDFFRYYYYYTLNIYSQSYGLTLEDLAADEEGFNFLKESIVSQLKQDLVSRHLAQENGIELDEEDMKKIESKIDEVKSTFETEEDFNEALKKACLTYDVYLEMQKLSALYDKVEAQLLTNGGKYSTSEEDFKKIVQDPEQYTRVIHILIPYYSQAEITDDSVAGEYESYTLYQKGNAKQEAYNALSEEEQEKVKEASKKVAEEVLEKVKNGEDFAKLVAEYGWDPGMESSPDGYYINQNTSFVEEFKTKSFELAENETSDLVENSSYGWFIIKRLPIDMEYVENNLETLISEYDTPQINQLFSDTINNMEVVTTEYYDKLTSDSIT